MVLKFCIVIKTRFNPSTSAGSQLRRGNKTIFWTMALYIILYGLLLCIAVNSDQSFEDGETDGEIYTNSWAVQLDTHDETEADEVAASLGFKNHGKIMPGYFKFVHEKTESRQKRSAEHHTQPLLDHPRVLWAKQQTLLFRYKRGFEAVDRVARAEKNRRFFSDPKWNDQWYFGTLEADDPRGNLGILDAVKQGYTGKGVVVTIIDDGLDHTHPDLSRNYDPQASYDVNDNDPDPKPNDSNLDNAHGTKCAGEVAAAANNGVCGVGVAHDAKIGGVRMLDGPVTDAVEGKALGFNCEDHVDIFSASWGPKDDGKTFGKPEELGKRAMENCALKGRREPRNQMAILYSCLLIAAFLLF
ncbi:PC3-like endoprotease variant B [Oculina patagonica]